ncbi:hypothetical protein [Bhargavaea ginsengi]|uniref:hypothetical protein n=1 Tax=Bhargavaea ginsengi TaxID=426757 RepID=UPI003C71557E
MELTPTVQLLYEATRRLNKSTEEIFHLARARAETERAYAIELSKTLLRLRAEGVPATLCGDLARGEVADYRFERDLATERHRSALAAMEALSVEIKALQSIANYQSEIGK